MWAFQPICASHFTRLVKSFELPGVDPSRQEKRELLERLDNLRGGVGGRVPPEPLEQGAARLRVWPEETVESGVALPDLQLQADGGPHGLETPACGWRP